MQRAGWAGKRAALVAVSLALPAALLGSMGGLAAAAAKAKPAPEPEYSIAYLGPLSGGNSTLGFNMATAVELAIKQANKGQTFGKLPFKLVFLAVDDQGLAGPAPAAAKRIIDDRSVVAVVGPAFTADSQQAEPLFSAAHLATVSSSATYPQLADRGWTNFFRVVADDDAQGPSDAYFAAKELHSKSVFSIDDGSAYARGLVNAFDSQATALHLVVKHETAPATTICSDGTGNADQYRALSRQVLASKAQLVFYGGYVCDFSLLVKALRSAGFHGKLMSDDGSLDPHYVGEVGTTDAEGTYLSCACADLTDTKPDIAFGKAFLKLSGSPSGEWSPESYDAANTIIDVMKSLRASQISRPAVVNGLHRVTYKGLTKVVRFQAGGNLAGPSVYLYKIANGQALQVGLLPWT
jgi:branched-chain amino acid transport system substrate-binding protein